MRSHSGLEAFGSHSYYVLQHIITGMCSRMLCAAAGGALGKAGSHDVITPINSLSQKATVVPASA